jgi:hypothetical protein
MQTTPKNPCSVTHIFVHYDSQLWVSEDLPLHKSVHNLAVTIFETRLDP